MIFCKVDVSLLHHPRLLSIHDLARPAALGVWLAALMYTREHELDGFVPYAALSSCGRARVVSASVTRLVEAGLLRSACRDGVDGVMVLNYAKHNETKEDIAYRRASTKARVDAHRRRCNGVTEGVTNAFVPDSLSVSVSVAPEPTDKEGARPLRPLPDRAKELASGIQMGAGPFDVEHEWRRFQTSGKRLTEREWQAWCVNAVDFAAKDRRKERANSEAKANAGYVPPPATFRDHEWASGERAKPPPDLIDALAKIGRGG